MYRRSIAWLLLFVFSIQIFLPTVSYGLSGGPSQPEFSGFAPIEQSEMVNVFTGDFSQNIPLFNVGDYPVNLVYQSGVTMDQEASWVGLGWTLNPGSINRDVRGIPDDFNGDQVTKRYNMKPNETYGVNLGAMFEIFGKDKGGLGVNVGIVRNNYKGIGINSGVNVSTASGVGGKGALTGSLGLNFSTFDGTTFSASAGLKKSESADNSMETKVGSSINSRAGLKELTVSTTSRNTNEKYSAHTMSGSISFAGPSVSPGIEIPMENYSFSLSTSLGGAFTGLFPNGNISGFYSRQAVKDKSRSPKAYGYLHEQNENRSDDDVMDVTREKDVPFIKNAQNIAIPVHQFDLFSATGQGVTGQFRAFRGDAGVLHDLYAQTTSMSANGSFDAGAGGLVHWGASIEGSYSTTTTKKWKTGNYQLPISDFQGSQKSMEKYEPVYFKMVGETTIEDANYLNNIYNTDLVQASVTKDGIANGEMRIFDQFMNESSDSRGAIKKNLRTPRSTYINALTAYEANIYGVDQQYKSCPNFPNYSPENYFINTAGIPGYGRGSQFQISRLEHPAHHLSEISITKDDGQKYVYGIPVYNNLKKEVTFSTDINSSSDGLVAYTIGDNSPANNHGRENYFSEISTPAYAQTYLLTAILSEDYSDVSGNGVSDDDKGNFTKFNYTRIANDFKWRIPIQQNKANYSEGLKSDEKDNKASYIYGEKEIWSLHSIESKNQVAVFYTSPRLDGFGVNNEDGLPNYTCYLMKLDSVRLFNKADLYKDKSNAVPTLVAYFEYNNSLCPSVPNSISGLYGKLTLTKVYFRYGSSNLQLNKYQFEYSAVNPAYNMKLYDRWGNYRESGSAYPSPDDFPYVIQDRTKQDLWTSAWHLNKITLPSGGVYNINYEAKDYAYVQNKRAMQMYKISALSSQGSDSYTTDKLYTDDALNNYILISLGTTVPDKATLYSKYMAGINQLFYKFYIDVDNAGHKEYVSGYAEVEDYGFANAGKTVMYVKLKASDGKFGGKFNPIARSAWQFLRMNLPHLAYPNPLQSDNPVVLIKSLLSPLKNIKELIQGAEITSKTRNHGRVVDLGKSYVRLLNGNFSKIGGGARVASIEFKDNWLTMTGNEPGASYTTDYDYTMQQDVNGVSTTISSGVATYEPMIGGEEIPYRLPKKYKQDQIMGASTELYSELPFGETFFPSPSVGYRKVTISTIYPAGVIRNKQGTDVNEFYTAYDYPVIAEHTALDPKIIRPNPLLKFLKVYAYEAQTLSQGFLISVNDMHGKPKAKRSLNASGAEMESETYYYKTKSYRNEFNQLDNNVRICDEKGNVFDKVIGQEVDMWNDMRAQNSDNIGAGIAFNTDGFIVPFFVAFLPTILPKFNLDISRYKSCATVKYINTSGILEKTVKAVNGSSVTTSNLIFDRYTGKPVVTSYTNEFKDEIVQYNVPAYYYYDQMGMKSDNSRIFIANASINTGTLSVSGAMNLLNEGDVIIPYDNDLLNDYYHTNLMNFATSNSAFVSEKAAYWVSVDDNNVKKIIDSKGQAVTVSQSGTYMVIESGHNNKLNDKILTKEMVNASGASVKDITKLSDLESAANYPVLNISANTYSDSSRLGTRQIIQEQCSTVAFDGNFLNSLFMKIRSYNNGTGTCFLLNPPNISLFELFKYSDSEFTGGTLNGVNFNEIYLTNTNPGQISSNYTFQLSNGCSFTIENSKYPGQPLDLCWLTRIEFGDCHNVVLPRNENTDCICFWTMNWFEPEATACMECYECEMVCVPIDPNSTINPYIHNLRSNWKIYEKWDYITNRTDQNGTSPLKRLGVFTNGVNGWNSTINGFDKALSGTGWVRTFTNTRVDNDGIIVEVRDPLDNYSSKLYRYNNQLVSAVASNAEYREIAFDDFEDYEYNNSFLEKCDVDHFNFKNARSSGNFLVKQQIAHTGKNSLLVKNTTVTKTAEIKTRGDLTSVEQSTLTNFDVKILQNGYLELFEPHPGQKYIVECWVQNIDQDNCEGDLPSGVAIVVDCPAIPSYNYTFTPTYPIVEGWVKITGEITIPAAVSIDISLRTNSDTYFDDFRIYPKDAAMKSYVYDNITLKLMAELDENNFATFYEYDAQGNLIRLKKETPQGILTIKEGRKHSVN